MANNSDYEVITGLSLASGAVTPQVVYLRVDADKTCKVVLPDGTTLTSTAGIINNTWDGAAGTVTLLVDKTSQNVYFGDYDDSYAIISDYIGDLYTTFNGIIQVADCTSLTSVAAPNATYLECTGCTSLTSVAAQNATNLYCDGCTSLTSVSAPNAIYLYCSGCALTSNAIASLLAELVVTGKTNGTLAISGGTNADFNDWSVQAKTDRATLDGRGWSITYNNILL